MRLYEWGGEEGKEGSWLLLSWSPYNDNKTKKKKRGRSGEDSKKYITEETLKEEKYQILNSIHSYIGEDSVVYELEFFFSFNV
jgi:hypothetical protein